MDFGFYQRPCEKCEGQGQVDDGSPEQSVQSVPSNFPRLPAVEEGVTRIFVVDHKLGQSKVILHVIDRIPSKFGTIPNTEYLASYDLAQFAGKTAEGRTNFTEAYDFVEAFALEQLADVVSMTSSKSERINWDRVGKTGLMTPDEWRKEAAAEEGW